MENIRRTPDKPAIPLTGCPALDRLLDAASPETLAAALTCLIVLIYDNDMGNRLFDSVEARIRVYVDGLDGPERNDGSPGPIERWLNLCDVVAPAER
jgi:hypothetical protein